MSEFMQNALFVILGFCLSEYLGGLRVRWWQRRLRDNINPGSEPYTRAFYELKARGFPDPVDSAQARHIADAYFFRRLERWKKRW